MLAYVLLCLYSSGMLSPDLPKVLDDIGIKTQPFGTLRQRYYEAVNLLVAQGREGEAIELIKLAVGITAFDEALTTPPAERRYRRPKNVHATIASSQLNQFNYTNRLPFCYEILTQSNYPELREAADTLFDGDSSVTDKFTLQLGKSICSRCVHRDTCDASLST